MTGETGKRRMHVLVTGAEGFVGRNLCARLQRQPEIDTIPYDLGHDPAVLDEGLRTADAIVHLAGVNRPQRDEEFAAGNAGFTAALCAQLQALGRAPTILLASSIQVALDNPYGASKRAAEAALQQFCAATGAGAIIYRFTNLFGKWCRPHYNSVTATFCHNVAHGLPLEIADPAREIELTYIDDVVAALLAALAAPAPGDCRLAAPLPARRIALGELAALIRSFHAQRDTLRLADFSDPFVRALYATYLSHLATDDFACALRQQSDARGSLAELLKSPAIGQMFVSRTLPGVTRGNHFHHTKTEKFMVVEGEAIIRFRQIAQETVLEYRVRGEEFRVVDIPPGYTHSIENVGAGVLVTLFWASEIFDPAVPDTVGEPVLAPAATRDGAGK